MQLCPDTGGSAGRAACPLPRPACGQAMWLPPGRLPAACCPLRAWGRGQPGRVSATRVSSRDEGINTGPGEGAWEGPEMAASLPFAPAPTASLPDHHSQLHGRGPVALASMRLHFFILNKDSATHYLIITGAVNIW